jgi:hypothetical protein|tara:strand:- start:188 stop:547 length:360 start_codon:yes stop_codon:yes gene_type:complete
MPSYQYIHPDTGETIEIIQKMKEDHVYIDESGIEWKRVFDVPNAAIDSDVDPFSEKEFLRHTAKKGMTHGEMTELSESLSKKREKARGLDPVKQKTVTSYEKKTGKPHPNKSGNGPKTL